MTKAKYSFSQWIKAYWATVIWVCACLISLIASVLGVWVAVEVTHCDQDGGRGGAVATAIILAAAFAKQSYAKKFYDILARRPQETTIDAQGQESDRSKNSAEKALENYDKSLQSDKRAELVKSVCLAFVTFIATLIWGFGDLIARHWMRTPFCPPH